MELYVPRAENKRLKRNQIGADGLTAEARGVKQSQDRLARIFGGVSLLAGLPLLFFGLYLMAVSHVRLRTLFCFVGFGSVLTVWGTQRLVRGYADP